MYKLFTCFAVPQHTAPGFASSTYKKQMREREGERERERERKMRIWEMR